MSQSKVLRPVGTCFSFDRIPKTIVFSAEDWSVLTKAVTRFGYGMHWFDDSVDMSCRRGLLAALEKGMKQEDEKPRKKAQVKKVVSATAIPARTDRGFLEPEGREPQHGPAPLDEVERPLFERLHKWLVTEAGKGFVVETQRY
jgi:hypothetical protein